MKRLELILSDCQFRMKLFSAIPVIAIGCNLPFDSVDSKFILAIPAININFA